MTMLGMSWLDSVLYRHRVGSIVPSSLRQVLRPIHSYNTHNFQIFRVLSSALLPGFIGPESSVLRVNLPPSVPCPASGSPVRFGFMVSLATNGYHHRRASLGKTLNLPISRPTSLRFGSPDIRSCTPTHARPPPRCHIVGSLFATYTGSASCFLRTPHFWKLPLPCWRCPSVR
jgi:hypothetical protein